MASLKFNFEVLKNLLSFRSPCAWLCVVAIPRIDFYGFWSMIVFPTFLKLTIELLEQGVKYVQI